MSRRATTFSQNNKTIPRVAGSSSARITPWLQTHLSTTSVGKLVKDDVEQRVVSTVVDVPREDMAELSFVTRIQVHLRQARAIMSALVRMYAFAAIAGRQGRDACVVVSIGQTHCVHFKNKGRTHLRPQSHEVGLVSKFNSFLGRQYTAGVQTHNRASSDRCQGEQPPTSARD